MNLTTLVFALFCIIVLTIYFIVPKKIQWIVLLVSSFAFLFYDNLNVYTIIEALIVLIPTYILGRLIEKHKNTNKSKLFLILGITIILAQLILLKYINLFVITGNYLSKLFNMVSNLKPCKIIH